MKGIGLEKPILKVLFYRWLQSWCQLFESLINILTFGFVNVWIFSLTFSVLIIKAQCEYENSK